MCLKQKRWLWITTEPQVPTLRRSLHWMEKTLKYQRISLSWLHNKIWRGDNRWHRYWITNRSYREQILRNGKNLYEQKNFVANQSSNPKYTGQKSAHVCLPVMDGHSNTASKVEINILLDASKNGKRWLSTWKGQVELHTVEWTTARNSENRRHPILHQTTTT